MSMASQLTAQNVGAATDQELQSAYAEFEGQLQFPEEVVKGHATPQLAPDRVETIRRAMMQIAFELWQRGVGEEQRFHDCQRAYQAAQAAHAADVISKITPLSV